MTIHQSTLIAQVKSEVFGTSKNGIEVKYFELQNKNQMVVGLTNYGATITNILIPDRDGRVADIVLGYDNLAGYEKGRSYFGCTVGRYANRINDGQFALNGRNFQINTNENSNALHGGVKGLDKKIWDFEILEEREDPTVLFSFQSPDGDQGFPGDLNVEIEYSLNSSNELSIKYRATTNKETVINLTNHSYFNLKDGGISSIEDHELELNSSFITPVDSELIPTGELQPIKNTAFDFTRIKLIGQDINIDNEQLKLGGGYDHNYVVDAWENDHTLRKIARVVEPVSGRILEISTTEPGVQFYSGNFLDGSETGKDGIVYGPRTGFCLETQHFPDSPNQHEFPTTTLKPGEEYNSTTILKFSTEK